MRKLLAALLTACLLCVGVLAAGTFPDGVSYGSAMGRNGRIAVSVLVQDGRIASIEVDAPQETPAKLQLAMQIVSRMIGLGDYASVQAVDTVSGATASSEGIKNAVLDALKEAKPVWGHGQDEPCPAAGYVDAPPYGSWAHEAVDWAVSEQILHGTGMDRLSPELVCTRAQIVTFLWRMAGSPIEYGALQLPFEDVERTAWYAQAVHWAVQNGVVNGVDATHFAPDADCTRAQTVTLLCRMAGSSETVILSDSEESISDQRDSSSQAPQNDRSGAFSDVATDAWYYDAVCWAAENGVTSGVGAGRFAPDDACTRAQIVTLLYRARLLLEEKR